MVCVRVVRVVSVEVAVDVEVVIVIVEEVAVNVREMRAFHDDKEHPPARTAA